MLRNLLAVGLVAAAVILFSAWFRYRKRHARSEELSQLKRRDDALNAALRNPQMDSTGASSVSPPIEISWDSEVVKRGQGSPMIELVELSDYSRRKYVFRAGAPIAIGRSKENQLSLCREGVEEVHCEIFLHGDRPCVRSCSRARTILVRKKTRALVSTSGVYLNSGDHICLGVAELQFKLLKA